MAVLSAQFWIMSLCVVLYDALSRCCVRIKLAAKTPQPFMANLPAARVQQCHLFSRVSIDYAGPL